jgi:hypothetical protein
MQNACGKLLRASRDGVFANSFALSVALDEKTIATTQYGTKLDGEEFGKVCRCN